LEKKYNLILIYLFIYLIDDIKYIFYLFIYFFQSFFFILFKIKSIISILKFIHRTYQLNNKANNTIKKYICINNKEKKIINK